MSTPLPTPTAGFCFKVTVGLGQEKQVAQSSCCLLETADFGNSIYSLWEAGTNGPFPLLWLPSWVSLVG